MSVSYVRFLSIIHSQNYEKYSERNTHLPENIPQAANLMRFRLQSKAHCVPKRSTGWKIFQISNCFPQIAQMDADKGFPLSAFPYLPLNSTPSKVGGYTRLSPTPDDGCMSRVVMLHAIKKADADCVYQGMRKNVRYENACFRRVKFSFDTSTERPI